MNRILRSVYAENILKFIDIKRKFGFKCSTWDSILGRFDNFAFKEKQLSAGLTKELVDKWSKRVINESEMTRYNRIRHLAEFSLFLCDLGIQSYIPKIPPCPKSSTFIPYIFSNKELEEIFKSADEMTCDGNYKKSILISIPSLFRLLYGTGIRISEALNLKNEDVNLKDKYIHVRDSKNGKARIIPISDTLASVFEQYISYRDELLVNLKATNYFFVNHNGKKCIYGVALTWFHKCLEKAQIQRLRRNHGPRIHDLRHTFAVTSLASMAEAGIDLYASIPVLSTYLGHQSFAATNHYVRITASMYPNLIKEIDTVCLNVFPKFRNYEAD
jgi:integrase